MRRNLFWLNDEQWERIEPLLPTDVRGKARVDDRRVISGIVHVIKSGCRWCDCPPEYGPYSLPRDGRYAGHVKHKNGLIDATRPENAHTFFRDLAAADRYRVPDFCISCVGSNRSSRRPSASASDDSRSPLPDLGEMR